jgi:hypothetical protein
MQVCASLLLPQLVRLLLSAFAFLQLLCDDVLNRLCWQQALCTQCWLVRGGADENHSGQALDLQDSNNETVTMGLSTAHR